MAQKRVSHDSGSRLDNLITNGSMIAQKIPAILVAALILVMGFLSFSWMAYSHGDTPSFKYKSKSHEFEISASSHTPPIIPEAIASSPEIPKPK